MIIKDINQLPIQQRAKAVKWIKEKYYTESDLLSVPTKEIMTKRFVAVMIDDSGNVIGTGSVMQPELTPDGLMMAEVGEFFTEPDYRGQGIASHILDQLESWSKDAGIDALYAFVCSKSVNIFCRTNYAASINEQKVAEIIPYSAIGLCKTVCKKHTEAIADQTMGVEGEAIEKALECKKNRINRQLLELIKSISSKARCLNEYEFEKAQEIYLKALESLYESSNNKLLYRYWVVAKYL